MSQNNHECNAVNSIADAMQDAKLLAFREYPLQLVNGKRKRADIVVLRGDGLPCVAIQVHCGHVLRLRASIAEDFGPFFTVAHQAIPVISVVVDAECNLVSIIDSGNQVDVVMLRSDPALEIAGTPEQADRLTTATIEELHRRSDARVLLAWNGNAKERRHLKRALGHEYESEAETVRRIGRRIAAICGRRPVFEDPIDGGYCDITLRTRSGIWRWEVKGATDWTARHHARHLDNLPLAAFVKEIGRMRGELGRRWIAFVQTFAHPGLTEAHALAMTAERFAEIRKIAAVDAHLQLVLRPTWWRPVDQWHLKHDLEMPRHIVPPDVGALRPKDVSQPPG